jgi:hypothetical protein
MVEIKFPVLKYRNLWKSENKKEKWRYQTKEWNDFGRKIIPIFNCLSQNSIEEAKNFPGFFTVEMI